MYCGQHPIVPYTQLAGSFIKAVLMLRMGLKEAGCLQKVRPVSLVYHVGHILANSEPESTLL